MGREDDRPVRLRVRFAGFCCDPPRDTRWLAHRTAARRKGESDVGDADWTASGRDVALDDSDAPRPDTRTALTPSARDKNHVESKLDASRGETLFFQPKLKRTIRNKAFDRRKRKL